MYRSLREHRATIDLGPVVVRMYARRNHNSRSFGAVWRRKARIRRGLAPKNAGWARFGARKRGKTRFWRSFFTIEYDPTYIVRTYALIAIDRVYAIKHHP